MAAETLTGTRASRTFPIAAAMGAGVLQVAWGKYAVSVTIEVGDIWELCRLPACTVIGGAFYAGDLDTGTETVEIDLGYAANGVDSADSDAFVNSGVLTGDVITDLIPAGLNFRPFQMSAGPIVLNAPTIVQAQAIAVMATPAVATIYAYVLYTAWEDEAN